MTRPQIEADVKAIVARSFGVDPATLSARTTAADVDGWDSLAHATLLMRLERVFNVDLDRGASTEAQDLGALTALVAGALGA